METSKLVDELGKPLSSPNKEISGAELKLQKERENLERAIETQEQREKKIQESLISQREAFAKDESYFDKYKGLRIDGRNVLVRVFVFKEEKISSGKIMLPKKNIQMRTKYEWSDTYYDERVLPIGKIIKVGDSVENKNIKEGSVVLLPTSEVEGYEKNPEFMYYLQFSEAKGMDPAFDKFEIPQELPAIQVNWKRHMFKHWDNLELDEEDMMTFLLPETKVMAVWGS